MRNKILLISMLIPGAVAAAIFFTIRLRDFRTFGDKFSLRSTDGFEIIGRISHPENGNTGRTAILVPDPALDINWDSQAVKTNAGELIAKSLSKKGYLVIRYDGRRPNDESKKPTRQAAAPYKKPVSMLAADLSSVAKSNGNSMQNKFDFVSHGESCATVLYAAKLKLIHPSRILLISCAYSGTLLDSWAARVFQNVSDSSADEQTTANMQGMWNAFKNHTEFTPTIKTPDLQIFSQALQEMGEENKQWAQEAAKIRPADLENELSGTVQVIHFLGEFDEVTPELDVITLASQKRDVRILKNTTFFLLKSDSKPKVLMEKFVLYSSPFGSVSNEAVTGIASVLE